MVNSTFWAIEEKGVFRPKIGQNRKMTKNMTGEMSLNDALLMLNSISRDRYKGKKALKFIYKAYVPI